MSVIPLETIKAELRVTHSADDPLLQTLLDASEDEAARFLNRIELPTLPQDYPPHVDTEGEPVPEIPATAENVAPSVYAAVFLLVRAKYDAVDADQISRLRDCAERILYPYRVGIGA